MAEVEIINVTATPLAVVRRRVTPSDLPTVIPEALGVVWQRLRDRAIQPLGRNVVVYLDTEMNVEFGVEVGADFVGDDVISRSATPAGAAAHIVHVGPYSKMSETYEKIWQWSKETGRSLLMPSWEVYGHWTQDESELRTDIYHLLEKK